MPASLAFLQNIGGVEILLICIVALLLFGSRLPDVARNIGKGFTQFKRGVQDATDSVKAEIDAAATPNGVCTATAVDRIRPRTVVDNVIAATAVEQVVAGRTVERIVALAAVECIVAALAADNIITITTG